MKIRIDTHVSPSNEHTNELKIAAERLRHAHHALRIEWTQESKDENTEETIDSRRNEW